MKRSKLALLWERPARAETRDRIVLCRWIGHVTLPVMVNSTEDVEAQLDRLERKYERLSDGTLLVRIAPGQPPAALRLSSPVMVLQVEFGKLPEDSEKQRQLFRKVLELNSSDLVHAAYGIASDTLVLNAALELVSLDSNELEAVLSDFDLALAEHTPVLQKLAN